MFRLSNTSKTLRLLVFFGLLVAAAIPTVPQFGSIAVLAHEVEVSGDVAATFHLEPNHNPARDSLRECGLP